MNVRLAEGADAAGIAELERELFGDDAWSEAIVLSEIGAEDRRTLVATDDVVIGYVITRTAGDVVDVHRIAVRPDHRRSGVGRDLLEAVTTQGRMLLEVSSHNTGALAFYSGEGFVEIDRRARYYRDGSDAVVMERKR